jgi:CheY-like chemotaxis protein/HPt (histidine-containing phosphotransfer) domain-containing protein
VREHLTGSSTERFHAAILDDELLEGAAGDAVRFLTGEPALGRTRLVRLTSLRHGMELGEPARAGFHGCLVRPVRRSQLLELVRDLGDIRARHTFEPLPVPAPAAPSTSAPPMEPPSAVLEQPRVLLVEDSRLNRRVVTQMLEDLGCAVESAADGRQAVQMVAGASYDLVLMDCQMPRMDGWSAAAKIRESEGQQGRVPIIALTGSSMIGDRERCFQSGMDDYVVKPVRLNELSTALQRWLPGAGAAADARLPLPTAESDNEPRGYDGLTGEEVDERLAADLARLRETFDHDEALLRDIHDLFLTEGPRLLGRVEDSLVRADLQESCRAAHELHGNLKYLHANEAAAAAGALEAAARAGDLEAARSACDEVRQTLEHLMRVVRMLDGVKDTESSIA